VTSLDKQQLLTLCHRPDTLFELFDEIDSTNRWLQTAPGTDIQFCIAESQSQGKGQQGRQWHSPPGQNIYLSCRWPFPKSQDLSGLSLAVSLAVLDVVQPCMPLTPIRIKWPNDIFCMDKKLGGILIELTAAPDTIHAIIGIGINVNMLPGKNVQIDQPWISLQEITKREWDRHILCAGLMNLLPECLNCFEHQGFSAFMKKWQAVDYLSDKAVKIQRGRELFYGTAEGVDPLGRLIIKNNNTLMKFVSGEASIVK